MTPRATSPQPSRDPAGVRDFVERLGSSLTDAGLQRLPARVFAALLADDDGRMTAVELAEVLDVSAASVSGAVRYLAGVNFLHREREAGTRRDVYVVRDDAWHDAMTNIEARYAPIKEAVASGVGAVGGKATRAGKRLALSVEFFDFITVEMAGIGERWEQHLRNRA